MKILLLCLLLPLSISAQSWEYWGTYKTKKIYIRPAQTSKFRKIVQISTKTIRNKNTLYARLAFDCQNNAIMQIRVKSSRKLFEAWNNFYPVQSNTFGAWMYQKACAL